MALIGAALALFSAGCSALSAHMPASVGHADLLGQGIQARIERAEARVVGVQKEIQKSINTRVEAARDAVNRQGVADWAIVAGSLISAAAVVLTVWINAQYRSRGTKKIGNL